MSKELYFYEIEVYPEPDLCEKDFASFKVEVTDDEFRFITSAYNNWQLARKQLLKKKKKI